MCSPMKRQRAGIFAAGKHAVTPLTSSSWATSTERAPEYGAPWLGNAGASSETSRPQARSGLFGGLTRARHCHCHPQQPSSTTTHPCDLIDKFSFIL